jgi:hypothetical protein
MDNEWINISDRLPESGLVLICSEAGLITVGEHEINCGAGRWRVGNSEVSWDYDYNLDFDVFSWMELPEPICNH